MRIHPEVLEVIVVGVPDERSTEVVKIFVVKKDKSLTEEEIKEHCKQNLTVYKRQNMLNLEMNYRSCQ